MWIRLGALGLFVCMLGALPPGVARAQPNALSLEIEPGAPQWLPRCLSEATLNTSYQAAREAEASTAPLAVHVRVVSQTPAREATLEIRAANAERSLGSRALPVRAEDCSAISDAVALVLVLLSRHAAAESPPPAAAPTETPPPPAAEPTETPKAPVVAPAPPPPPKPPPPPPEAESSIGWNIDAGALLMLGMLPDPAFGVSLGAELVLGVPSVRLRALLLFPQSRSVAEGSVKFSAYELALDACLGISVADAPRIGLRVCAGPRVGFAHAAGSGFALENYQPTDPTLYLGLGPEANLGLTDWAALQLGVGVAAGILRPRYVLRLQDSGLQVEVADPGPVRAEVDLCLLLIF